MAYAQTQFTNSNALYNGNIELDATVEAFNPNGLISFLFYSTAFGGTAANPNGYIFKFDSKNGDFAGRIYKVAAGVATEIGTNPSGIVVNAAQLTGAHAVKCYYNKNGKMHMIVDGLTVVTASDTTYAVNNTVGYGEEGGAGYVSKISVKGHAMQAASELDPNMRAQIDLSQTHINKQVDGLTDNVYAKPLASRVSSGKPLIDFGEGIHLNKILDNINDGSSYARVTVNALTTNTIDFSKSGFTAKNVDNVSDGSTYGRPILSRLSAGKPLIDFGEGIHLNKQLDNIADGTTYGRPKLTALSSGVPKKDILHMFSGATLDNDGIRIDVTNAVG